MKSAKANKPEWWSLTASFHACGDQAVARQWARWLDKFHSSFEFQAFHTELQGQSQKPEIQILNGIYQARAPTATPLPGHHMHEMTLLEITTQVY